VVGNIELRLRSPIYSEYLQWTLFTDVGEVWNRSGTKGLGFEQLKWTPGVGVRIFSIFGAIRVDVGYNPYPKPNGPIYFDAPIQGTNRDAGLFCVTPGNVIPIVDGKAPESFVCPSTFEPRQRTTFLRRLTVNLSIGQAF
jgi:outer membrane protein insertion porin family/translocation and assembly module TamA